ncbi:ArsR family transcriptional regulator [Streptomyces dangxiongensis]|uniref:ArsR family transcriptional regulator n=1 Tax=Streptomyces dangxiongensis TaxID=1442032 RepID=A0A3G2JQI8_9ACTN|nr:helix-turn-helix domain-containing protein [Streptomyces dangxiongensis]AYN43112.1 ArsR family transcriptional regulator [Streptomyces dangxiongensis]
MGRSEHADLELAVVLHALGDPVRLALVRRMAEAGESACSPDGMEVPRSTLSNHWRILREAGITRTRRVGKARLMTLCRAGLDARFPGLLAAVLGEDGR